MSAFNGFLGQLADGVLSPKGNLGDYAHASRLFVTENQKLAPHQKFHPNNALVHSSQRPTTKAVT